MKMKQIAFYIGSLSKGGSERTFVNLAEYFYEQGYQVTIVTQYKKENEYTYSEGIERILSDLTEEETGKSRIMNFIGRYRKLRRIWKQIKPDVILSCIGKNNLMSVASALGLKSRTVVSVVGEPSEEYPTGTIRLLANILFSFADGVVLKTTDAMQFFPRYIRNKSIVMKNSLNPTFIRETYQGTREKTIISVGRLDSNKNQTILIKAFARLSKEHPEYDLILYGEGEDRNKLEEMVHKADLDNKIMLPGTIENVAETIYKAGIFVLTSNTEGMPNALIEAMALGIPSISTDCPCGGPRDLIQTYENGILIPVNDVNQLEKEIRNLIDNPELAEKIGRNATAVQQDLSPEVINKNWENYFRGLVNKG
ncbi:MAG: glycosyltransferase [Lachnospiraceae bacterium]|nr:glycosyltransferase [Lachnospiraceae bacterium]